VTAPVRASRPGALRVPQVLGPAVGGIRAHVAALAPRLERRGVDAPVLGPSGGLGPLGEVSVAVGIPAGVSPVRLFRARRTARPWLRGADVVHAHGLKAAAVAGGPGRGAPLVVTVHNVVLPDASGRVRRSASAAAEAVWSLADRLVVPSEAVLSGLPRRLRSRSRVVVPVVDAPVPRRARREVRAGWGVDDDAPVVVAVARLHPQKGLDDLLAAWSEVLPAVPDARLVLVGDGPERLRLQGRAGPGVVFAGASDNAADELAAADLAVVSSRWEAVPLVLVEAVALGIPVVSTRVGVADDVASGDPSVHIVEVGDRAGMAVALTERLRVTVPSGSRGGGLPSWCDPDHLVDRVLDVYRELV